MTTKPICNCPPSDRSVHRITCPAAFSDVRPTPPTDDVREAPAEAARDSVDRIGGWKHLRKFSGMSAEWMDVLRDAIICRVADALGEVRPHGTVTPPADDMHANNVSELLGEAREIVASWDLRGSWTSESPVGLVARLADALEIAAVRPHGTVTDAVDNLRFVNAAVVLAALAQMEEVAADRQQLQSVKLSILRRRIASLQRQIENQAAEVRPHGTVTDAADVDSNLRAALAGYLDLRTVARVMADLEAAREVHP